MHRRDFLGTATATFGAPCALRVHAQSNPSPRKRYGYLTLDPESKGASRNHPFFVAMQERGWIRDENLLADERYADGKPERLTGFAEELVRKRVDLIITNGPAPTLAAARATRTIPIVFFGVNWSVELGLVDSFARPGRNVTGLAPFTGLEISAKRHEFLRQMAPKARRLSWLWGLGPTSFETISGSKFDAARANASAIEGLGFETRFHPVKPAGDNLEEVFNEIVSWRAEALSLSDQLLGERQRISEFALRHRLPITSHERAHVEAGALLSYGPPASELANLLIRLVGICDRVLRGVPAADIPVESPSRYELIVNLKTAYALGLTAPTSLLVRADEVIQ